MELFQESQMWTKYRAEWQREISQLKEEIKEQVKKEVKEVLLELKKEMMEELKQEIQDKLKETTITAVTVTTKSV